MDEFFLENNIFSVSHNANFDELALQVFDFQYQNNAIYRRYVELVGCNKNNVKTLQQIPYMPVEFFKNFTIKTTEFAEQQIFTSSGTTGQNTSRHYVKKLEIYYKSLIKGFCQFYGPLQNYIVLALLPAYLERKGSSLVAMVQQFMQHSGSVGDGFYLYDFQALSNKIHELKNCGKKILLIGVTFALLDFAEQFPQQFGDNVIVMETGGMKGRRKEIVREQVHEILCNGLGVSKIHSEYGMTELLSQAYSDGDGIYRETSTMKILIRDATDPFQFVKTGISGGINVIDLANIYSCSFLETRDLGVVNNDGTFKVLGRFDNSDTRGCNLLYV